MQVSNAPGDGIRVTDEGADNSTVITNTQVNSRLSDLFISHSGGDGIRVFDAKGSVTDSLILNSWVASSGKSAINLDDAAGWQVINNHLYGVQRHAIFANRCFGTTIADNCAPRPSLTPAFCLPLTACVNADIEDFGGVQQTVDALGSPSDPATFFGIACTVQGGATSVIRHNKVLMMSYHERNASVIASSRFVHVGIPRVNYGIGMVSVVGNAIRGANSSADIGLSYAALKPGTELKVVSGLNLVEGVGTPRDVAPTGVTLAPADL